MKEVSLEQTQEFYDFLQGKSCPDCLALQAQPELSPQEAFDIIYYLQEILCIIPDRYEVCHDCGIMFDSEMEGTCIDEDTKPIEYGDGEFRKFSESEYGNYCDMCRPD